MTKATPFENQALPGRTFFEWLLRKRPSRAALAEVNNLLAQATTIRTVSPEAMDDIAVRYQIPIARKFRPELEGMYRRYLEWCLRDRHLSEDEVQDLQHLKVIVGLTDQDVSRINDEIARDVFRQTAEEAVADGQLTEQERAFLDRLQQNLNLDPQTARRIYEAAARNRVHAGNRLVRAQNRHSLDPLRRTSHAHSHRKGNLLALGQRERPADHRGCAGPY